VDALPARHRRTLETQQLCAHSVGIWLLWPAALAWLKYVRGYRIRDLTQVRRRFQKLLAETSGPLLLCCNHLTWIDSMLVQWALVSSATASRSTRLFVWNLPEKKNFNQNVGLRTICYLGKCLPITRGGDREQQRLVLDKVRHLLERRELVLAFPEGGRSRTGRFDADRVTYGVGRFVHDAPDCSVLCIYLRGDGQERMSVLPPKGETFSVDLRLVQPRSRSRGLRAHRDIARQIVATLSEMEQDYFDRR